MVWRHWRCAVHVCTHNQLYSCCAYPDCWRAASWVVGNSTCAKYGPVLACHTKDMRPAHDACMFINNVRAIALLAATPTHCHHQPARHMGLCSRWQPAPECQTTRSPQPGMPVAARHSQHIRRNSQQLLAAAYQRMGLKPAARCRPAPHGTPTPQLGMRIMHLRMHARKPLTIHISATGLAYAVLLHLNIGKIRVSPRLIILRNPRALRW
jgi:hypothetical protein